MKTRSQAIGRSAHFAEKTAPRTGLKFRCGELVPVFDGLMLLYEACAKRPFRAALAGAPHASDDEAHLLALLLARGVPAFGPALARAEPGLLTALDVSLKSTSIMVRRTFPHPSNRRSLRLA